MNEIRKSPVDSLGYNFITPAWLPKGKDEYYLRNKQNNSGIQYRQLTAHEIEALVRNRNTSDNWGNILVSEAFNAELVQDCKFFGLVRIGKLEPYYLEFHNLRRPVGLYNSTIISCDFGHNVVVDNVNYISHYIVGSDVMLVNVNEIATTEYAKFGNGILKEGESENRRIWMEVCNENGGRNIIPFVGMLPGDAFIWTRFRDNHIFQQKLIEFTDKAFDHHRGFYGTIGERTVIKNCRILKDVNIGSDAYLKGANKIKNVTIHSSAEAKSQIGEGCELVNGIVDYGCRIFYGVKAVRFYMSSHSQLKYGARLINSFLGNNSTISCCEVLNSLIFPAHEQHHNNSFLCAALLGGQSNMAAGATIGSNHNSRSADGEIAAGRGFWPGLCVSLKHNSLFASFSIIAKGDYPAELSIPIPFSLISQDLSNDQMQVMPGYWFFHNMYALARNSWKYTDRDKRTDKSSLIEYDYLAPDTINEMIRSLDFFCEWTGKSYLAQKEKTTRKETAEAYAIGKKLLEDKDPILDTLVIYGEGLENSHRKVKILKLPKAYHLFKELIQYHVAKQLIHHIHFHKLTSLEESKQTLPTNPILHEWVNTGGQLITATQIEKLKASICSGKIKSWKQVHEYYQLQADNYATDKLHHAIAAYKKVFGINLKKANEDILRELLTSSITTREWMTASIHQSRSKDYQNKFRQLLYGNKSEMEEVIGKLSTNSFILQEKESLETFKKEVAKMMRVFRLPGGKKRKYDL